MMEKKLKLFFKSISILCLIVFFAAGFSGCATIRHTAQRTVVPMLDTSVDDLVSNLLRTKNGAFIKDGLPGALLIVTGLTEMAPTNYRLLARTSFLYAAYGLFIEDGNEDYAISLYKVGTEYGLRAMKVNNSKFRKAVESGTPIYKAAKLLTKDDLEGLTWYVIKLAKRATLQLAVPEETTDVQDAIATAKRSTELDPNYAWGANWVILGIFYAVVPSYGGLGSGEKPSRDAFINANKVEKGDLGLIDTMVARYLCPLLKDEDWYDQLNKRVIEMDNCNMREDLCIMNELAKQKARYNMENKVRYMGY
jgi:hypothetical protein